MYAIRSYYAGSRTARPQQPRRGLKVRRIDGRKQAHRGRITSYNVCYTKLLRSCDLSCAAFGGACAAWAACGGSADRDGDGLPDACNTPPDCSLAGAEDLGGYLLAYSWMILVARLTGLGYNSASVRFIGVV